MFRIQKKALKAPFTLAIRGEARKIIRILFMKYLTPPDFCHFDVTRCVVNDSLIGRPAKNGGVLRGSSRRGLRVESSEFRVHGLELSVHDLGFKTRCLGIMV